MKEETISVDFCVVGGGLAGMIAAISAARHGAKVALIQDRPVLGGNSSSEIRMHVCGAHGENRRETGLIEELMLDNYFYNHTPTYSMWDTVLYAKAQYQDNLTLILNASVNALTKEGACITSVRAWQMTTETWITVRATLFADCSGDGILAPLSGADHRVGREARSEFNESIAPEVSDKKTMGMSCLFQAREHDTPQPFKALPWAYDFSGGNNEWVAHRGVNIMHTNFWWMEVGGEVDSIHDTEKCREDLVRIAFGVWDYLKNHADDRDKYANFSLDWQSFLPGKRESRRYCGDRILNQNDVESEGKFSDLVAYGGWSMDDHFPGGFYHKGPGTIFHPAPSPFGIPYRSLYSRNIENLFCAGRCHSATHSAMSATRVMGTTALMGQAVGTAAAIAIRDALSPRGVYELRIAELRQTLMEDDCWLPWHRRGIPSVTAAACLSATGGTSPEPLRNGIDRPVDGEDNGWLGATGDAIEYRFPAEVNLTQARLVFDSDLNRTDPSRGQGQRRLLNMRYYRGLHDAPFAPPATLVRDFRLEGMNADGTWSFIHHAHDNFQRLVRVPVNGTWKAIRFVPEGTWGADAAHLFAFDVR